MAFFDFAFFFRVPKTARFQYYAKYMAFLLGLQFVVFFILKREKWFILAPNAADEGRREAAASNINGKTLSCEKNPNKMTIVIVLNFDPNADTPLS